MRLHRMQGVNSHEKLSKVIIKWLSDGSESRFFSQHL
jgi:hypothetical protein